MKHAHAVLPLLLAAAALASAEGRNPAIRVSVRSGQGAPDGKAESMLDVQEILQQRRPDPVLAYAAAGEPADLGLWITRRYTTRRSVGGAVSSQTAGLVCIVEGIVIDVAAGNAESARKELISGASVIWHGAALQLVDALAEYAEARQHELLRQRPDWPDLGFEFEALTKERKKQFGVKNGKVVVTHVRPDGPAQGAGLLVADAILGLGDKSLKTPAELGQALYAADPGAELRLEVARRGARRTLTLAIP